jgi:hypothetical protein
LLLQQLAPPPYQVLLAPKWMLHASTRTREAFAARFDAFGNADADAAGPEDVRRIVDEQVGEQVVVVEGDTDAVPSYAELRVMQSLWQTRQS